MYLPALTGSRITTKLPPLSRNASSPVLPLVVGGMLVLLDLAPPDSVVNLLSALLTTPLHSRGQALECCLCSHRSDSVPANGKLARPCVFPYNIKSSESSEYILLRSLELSVDISDTVSLPLSLHCCSSPRINTGVHLNTSPAGIV